MPPQTAGKGEPLPHPDPSVARAPSGGRWERSAGTPATIKEAAQAFAPGTAVPGPAYTPSREISGAAGDGNLVDLQPSRGALP
jgi:hypothetical protein